MKLIDIDKKEIMQQNLIDNIQDTIDNSKSVRTQKEYKKTMELFINFCEEDNIKLGFQGLVLFLQDLQNKKRSYSTIRTYFYSLKTILESRGLFMNDTEKVFIKAFMQGTKNKIGSKQQQKAPVLRENKDGLELKDIINYIENSRLKDKKQYKLAFYLAFMGGFRISEVLSLQADNIIIDNTQVYIDVIKSKTGYRQVLINSDNDLHDALTGFNGFTLSYMNINNAIKRVCKKKGLDLKKYGTHSCRAGFVTQAILNGYNPAQIMNRTGHKSIAMLSRYDRIAQDKQDTLRV